MFFFIRSQARHTTLKSPMQITRWPVSFKSLIINYEEASRAHEIFCGVEEAAETPYDAITWRSPAKGEVEPSPCGKRLWG